MSDHINTIDLRLGNRFNEFLKQKKFIDCRLICGETVIPCHRFVLAKVSKWFERYFIENPTDKYGSVCNVEITVNPDNILQNFVDLIYTNYAEITIQNLPPYLKMANYYECPSLSGALQHFYLDATNDETVLELTKKFIELGLDEDAKLLAPCIAKHLKKIHNNEADLRYTIKEIYESLSPPVLAAVLKEVANLYSLNQEHNKESTERRFTDEDKVQYIDEFVSFKNYTDLDESEKEALASSIDWESPEAFQFLTRHKCDWIPARISRPLINRILNCRRSLQRSLEKNKRNAEASVSRWYVYAWAHYCRNAETVRVGCPSVDVISFIRTLGNLTDPIDVVKYGFVKSFSTTEPITADFDSSNAILANDDLYFMAQEKDKLLPGVGFDLGENSRFIPSAISLNSNIKQRRYIQTRPYNPKPYIKSYCFKVGNNLKDCIDSLPIYQSSIPLENKGAINKIPINNNNDVPKLCNSMMFQLNGPCAKGAYMMRVVSMEVNGQFVCKEKKKQ